MEGDTWVPHTGLLTSVCTIAGRCVRRVFTVWNISTTPSYRMRSRAMLRVINTPVRPTPALLREWLCQESCPLRWGFPGLQKHPPPQPYMGTAPPHLQCTVMGPSCPNCSFVLCTCPMKSMKPSPVLGTPCSGQSVNWNCRIVLDCPSWERWSGDRVKVCTSGTRPSRHRDALTRTLRGNTHSLYFCSLSSRGLGADPDSHEVR